MSRLSIKVDQHNLSHDQNLLELTARNTHTTRLTNYRDILKLDSPSKCDTSFAPRMSTVIEVHPLRKNTKKNIFGKKNTLNLKLDDFKYIPLNNKRIEIVPESDGPYQTYMKSQTGKPVRNGKRVFNPLLTPSTSRTTEHTFNTLHSQSDIAVEGLEPENMQRDEVLMEGGDNGPERMDNEFLSKNPPPQSKVHLAPESGGLEFHNKCNLSMENKCQNEIFDSIMKEIEREEGMNPMSAPQKPAPRKTPKKKKFDLELCRKICDEFAKAEPKVEFPKSEDTGSCAKCIAF